MCLYGSDLTRFYSTGATGKSLGLTSVCPTSSRPTCLFRHVLRASQHNAGYPCVHFRRSLCIYGVCGRSRHQDCQIRPIRITSVLVQHVAGYRGRRQLRIGRQGFTRHRRYGKEHWQACLEAAQQGEVRLKPDTTYDPVRPRSGTEDQLNRILGVSAPRCSEIPGPSGSRPLRR